MSRHVVIVAGLALVAAALASFTAYTLWHGLDVSLGRVTT